MAHTLASAVILADPDRVWDIVRDFNGLPSWHPAIKESRLEPSGPMTVGVVRHLTLGDGATVSERLLSLDDLTRTVVYTFTDSPFPVRRYVATITVTPITATGESFVSWTADFDADADDQTKLAGFFADQVFATGLAALRDRFTS
jgi:hypothetical protein